MAHVRRRSPKLHAKQKSRASNARQRDIARWEVACASSNSGAGSDILCALLPIADQRRPAFFVVTSLGMLPHWQESRISRIRRRHRTSRAGSTCASQRFRGMTYCTSKVEEQIEEYETLRRAESSVGRLIFITLPCERNFRESSARTAIGKTKRSELLYG